MLALDSRFPALPLILCDVPPGLVLALGQEGVPTVRVSALRGELNPSLRRGRFVLFDRRTTPPGVIRGQLAPEQVAIDVDRYRGAEGDDPFEALVDSQGEPTAWSVQGLEVVERMARFDKALIRRRVVDRVRRDVVASGGLWARLASFPFPYRSAFNLRVDLDENHPEDYARFALARKPIDDCSTHFVSTAAYGGLPGVLADLRRVDAQSHGHFHHVYRDLASNRRNLERAHAILVGAGFAPPEGFAGPHGRWNPGLDGILEEMGYRYSSDFQLGYDDRPFFPWLGDRFSRILQVPVHPLCEGAFFEAGGTPRNVADHLVATVRSAIDAGEPAFVYGHPEARLGRYPQIVSALADAVEGEELVWRTTLTEFARWWRYRGEQSWSVMMDADDQLSIQFDDLGHKYPLAVEVVRSNHVATVPITTPSLRFPREALVYERRAVRVDRPEPTAIRPPRGVGVGVRAKIRSAIDWETVTPLAEIATDTVAGRIKRGLRRWKGH